MIKKLYILILSMIIIVSCSKNNPNNPNNGGNGDGGTTPTENKYDTLFLKFVTDDKTVPTFTFFEDDGQSPNGARKWEQSTDGTNTCYIYNAPDGESKNGVPTMPGQFMELKKLKIYVYKGINPFKTKVENDIEKQFYFYRYIGNAGYDLDNFLIAVDTKTGYVFPYAVPEDWMNMVLAWGPNGWISAELGYTMSYPSNPANEFKPPVYQKVTFTSYKFWQYDPIGQVNEDGTVSLEQFYIDGQASGDYAPKYTGKSPYKDIQ